MIALNLPLVTWIVIVVFAALFIIISLCYRKKVWHKKPKEHHTFIEVSSDQDEFFVPGDPVPGNEGKQRSEA